MRERQFLTVPEAAEAMNLTRPALVALCEDGRVRGAFRFTAPGNRIEWRIPIVIEVKERGPITHKTMTPAEHVKSLGARP